MTNDTTETPQQRQVRKFRSLGESHINGSHDEHPIPGCLACLLSGKNATDFEHVKAVKARHSAAFMQIPGVAGVGVGKDDEGFCIRVYLEIADTDVPATVDGVRVVTDFTGPLRAIAYQQDPAS